MTNTGTANLVISAISITGTNANQFSFASGTLPITVAPNATSTINVTFSPTTTGAKSATLSITDNANGSPHSASLSGTGTAPLVSIAPSSIPFGNILVGQTSSASNVTVTNAGTADLTVSSISITGTNAAEFAFTSATLPITVPAGQNTVIPVTFTPASSGAKSASLTIADNVPGSPQTVALTGTGIAPAVTLGAASINFGNQLTGTTSNPATTLQVTNSGTANLTISNIQINGTNATLFGFSSASLPINLAPNASTNISVTFTPDTTGAKSASLVITDNAANSPQSVSLSGTGVAPGYSVAPTFITYPNQLVGSSSSATPVVVTNNGTANLVISAISLTGTDASQFSETNTTLPITVAPNSNTTINVTFSPTSSGSKSASLSLTDNAAGSPHAVALSGTAIAPGFSVAPPSVTFANQLVGTASSNTPVVITNNGTANLTVSAASLTGTNASEFILITGTLPATIAPNNTLTLNVKFAPTSTGSKAAAISITDNAAGSPHSVGLSGTAVAPGFSPAPTSLTFANQLAGTSSSPTNLVITNNGTADLTISSIAKSGTDASQFSFTSATLPITVTAGNSTTVPVTFSPTTGGAKSASLTFTDNVTGSPQSVALTGTGIAPNISISPTSAPFGNQLINTSSTPTNLTITNTGTADLTISNVAISGTNASDFSFTAGTLPITVTAGNTTTIAVTFTPAATGSKTATLSITDNVNGSPHTVALTGTGTAPGFSSSSSMSFGNQNVGTSSSAQGLVVTNNGTANLVISAIALSGTNSSEFSFTSSTLPITVAPNTTTTVNVTFSPTSTGSKAATLTFTDNAGSSPQAVSLAGIAVAPAITIAPTSLTFANQNVGSSSAAQPIQITNSGTANLNITALSFTGTNPSDFTMTGPTLPASIPPNGSVTVNVKFAPTASGARSGSLSITDNATGSPHLVPLSGTGVGPTYSVDQATVDFGDTLVNQTSNTVTITVTNTGNANLVITNLMPGGTNSSEFFAAPAGGATLPITVTPGNTMQIISFFQPTTIGSKTGTITLTDNAPGSPHVINLKGNSIGPHINLTPLTLGSNLQASIITNLEVVAPSGGLPVTITSSDSSKVLLSTNGTTAGTGSITITIPANQNGGFTSFYVQAAGAAGTSATLTATASGYTSGSTTITIAPSGFVLSSPVPPGLGTSFNTTTTSANTTLTINAAQLDSSFNYVALGQLRGGVTVNVPVTSGTPATGTITTSPVTFTGGSAATVTTAFHPVAAGTSLLSAGAPAGFSTPAQDSSLTATVSAPHIILNPNSVGANLETSVAGSLDSVAPTGGLQVTVTSSDPTKLLLSTDITGKTAGSGSITITVPAGMGVTSGFPGFVVQSLATSGTVTLTASATGYVSGTASIALTPSAFVISSPNGVGKDFSTTTRSANTTLTVSSYQLDASLNPLGPQPVRPGQSYTVTLSGGGAIGTLNPNSLSFTAGTQSMTTSFHPVSGGTTTIGVTEPSGFATPTSDRTLVATVTQPHILLLDKTVGQNLQVPVLGSLDAAPSGNLSITVTSSDPNVILSTNPTALGTSSITLTVTSGSTIIPTFYVQGLASTTALTQQITATATGYASATNTVTLAPSGIVLAGPSGTGTDFQSSVSQADKSLNVIAVALDPADLSPTLEEAIRGGFGPVAVAVTNSNPAAGTVNGTPASITTSNSRNSAALTFHPISTGQMSTLAITTQPSGFSTPSSGTSMTVTVVP